MKSRSGFTLVELVVALMVLSTIIIVVSEVYLRGMISSKSEISESHLQTEAKNILDGMMANIKQAALVEPSYGGYTSSESQLVLAVPAIDAADDFVYTGDSMVYDYIVYFREGSGLHKVVISEDSRSKLYSSGDPVDRVILTDTKSLTFEYSPAIGEAKSVSVNLTAEDDTQKSPQDITLEAEARLRND